MENTQCSDTFWRRRMLTGLPGWLGALTCYTAAVAHRDGGISILGILRKRI